MNQTLALIKVRLQGDICAASANNCSHAQLISGATYLFARLSCGKIAAYRAVIGLGREASIGLIRCEIIRRRSMVSEFQGCGNFVMLVVALVHVVDCVSAFCFLHIPVLLFFVCQPKSLPPRSHPPLLYPKLFFSVNAIHYTHVFPKFSLL